MKGIKNIAQTAHTLEYNVEDSFQDVVGVNPICEWADSTVDQWRDPSNIFKWSNGHLYFYANRFTYLTFAGNTSNRIDCFKSNLSTFEATELEVFQSGFSVVSTVLEKGNGTDWDAHSCFTPNIIELNGTIYLLYTASKSGTRWNIMYATSNNPEFGFTKHSTPIIWNYTDNPSEAEAWENFRIDASTPIILPNGRIRCYYKGVDTLNGTTVNERKFGYAECDIEDFPTGLVKVTVNNPFFDESDTYNNDDPEGPSVWYQFGKYYMVYATPSSTGFGIEKGDDGVTWSNVRIILDSEAGTWDFERWHGATYWIDNGECKAILFHDERANNDVVQFGVLLNMNAITQ